GRGDLPPHARRATVGGPIGRGRDGRADPSLDRRCPCLVRRPGRDYYASRRAPGGETRRPARAAGAPRPRRLLRAHAEEAELGRPLRPRATLVLTELRVRDLAVIADVALPVTSGLNVLTGETGAGKSMLVDALALPHGQHETQSLLKSDAQRDILDAYAAAGVERTAVRDAYDRLQELERREAQLTAKREEVRRKADYLRHVVNEIEHAAPQAGEAEALEVEAKRLGHADELGRLSRALGEALDTTGLARAAKLFAGLTRLDPSTRKWQELFDGAFANLEELRQAARDYAAGMENDPGRLAAVEQRRDVLYRLTQKYGPTLPDVLATRDRSARELELPDTADLDLRNLAEQRERAAGDFTRACAALTTKRTRGAGGLSKAVKDRKRVA